MEEVPAWFRSCVSEDGTYISLETRGLTAVPPWLEGMTEVTSLRLDGNELSALPEFLGRLTALKELRLDGNRLSTVPDSIGGLTALHELRLDGNRLSMLPESLGDLAALSSLRLEENELSALPEFLGRLTALKELRLEGNRLSTLPDSIGGLIVLTSLNLADNQLSALPDSFGSLGALTILYLRLNSLIVLPDSLGRLTKLSKLDLSLNELAVLPESFAELANLTTLNLAVNQLTALPNSFDNLIYLTELDLANNQLTVLPDAVTSFSSLTMLRLEGNQLTTLPETLSRLAKLQTLRVDNNQLATISEGLSELTDLSLLGLTGNPLQSPLLEIAEDGTKAILAYLQLISGSATEMWKSKLLVVGEGAVGKTSLVKALAGQKHDPNEPITHGIRIVDLEFSHPVRARVRMSLSSWDFGGQDIYHATHQFFLSDRSLFILLWNARQGWEQAKLPYWLDIIKARAPNARVILVATHSEGHPIDLPLTDLRTSFPQIVDSMSVDSSTHEGIDELRRKMAEEAMHLPLMGSKWPTAWVRGVEVITTFDQQHTTPEELYDRLFAAGVTDRSHQAFLLRALHLLGEILYFDDDEELRDTVILRPQWVNSYIAKVLNSQEVAVKYGVLTRPHARQLWSDLDPGLRDRFLLMMEKFDLSYRIPDDPSAASLVVERLSWDSPAYEWQWRAALREPGAREIRLRYQLNTLPPGVPTWFIAREHRFTMDTHWRSGALLRYTGDARVLGLIRAERHYKTVDLAVHGPVPQLFFSVLQDGFESTLSRYQGLEITRLVPCICGRGDGTQDGQPCMHLYQYGPLLRRLEQHVSEVECELSFAKVNVADLLFGIAPATTDQLVSRLERIDRNLNEFRAEAAWAHREFLKTLRRSQARAEAVCPSVFTLTPHPSKYYWPGIYRLELRLYCEQPGAFHALSGKPYTIEQPARWLVNLTPYLLTVIHMLKHSAPLVGPVLGLTSERLAQQLTNETSLMTELIDQLPEELSAAGLDIETSASRPMLDADYRALKALFHQVDPSEQWGGLSRTLTPEGEVLWLCRDHAGQYDI